MVGSLFSRAMNLGLLVGLPLNFFKRGNISKRSLNLPAFDPRLDPIL
jgi:hypothetical protein